MFLHLGFDIRFRLVSPTPMVLVLHTHPSREDTLCLPDRLDIQPGLPIREYFDGFGNRCSRIVAPPGDLRISGETVVSDSGLHKPTIEGLRLHPVEELPSEILQFLLPSRYCEVDLLTEIAWSLFGHTPVGWQRVESVCDWVHNSIEFGYHDARKTRTALETYKEGEGVCRDFQHLVIAFCRTLNIPARHATGYLGDIGVPPSADPMDFSAWFAVYLEGRWRTLDARNNTPRIGRVLMARGRDAADVAMTTSFGVAELTGFQVWTEELADFSPATLLPKLSSGAL